MAEQLSLVVRDDFISDIDALDLLPMLNYNGWQMAIADDDAPVDEALVLHIAGTSDNDLATRLQALSAMLIRVRQYQNPLEKYGVWLRHQMPGETGARQALIMQAQADKANLTDVQAVDHYLREVVLGLKRSAAWEASDYSTYTADALGTIGAMADLGAVAGDLPARLARTRIEDPNGGSSPFSHVWAGLRSNRFGIATSFVPRWEAELGHPDSAKGAAITSANDATATGGQEIAYEDEEPTVTDGAFAVAHPPVKAGSISATATIDGNDFDFADSVPPTGELATEGEAAWAEVQTDNTLDHLMPTPGSLHFFANGSEIAVDDGVGALIQSIGLDSDTWYFAGEPYWRTLSHGDILPGSVTGTFEHLTDNLAIYDDEDGNLFTEDAVKIGELDCNTGEVLFFVPVGTTVALVYLYTPIAPLTPGTIDYLTGEWSLPDATGGTISVTYAYNNLTISFDYTDGTGLFDQAYLRSAVEGLVLTYTGYHNKSIRVTFTDPTLQARWWMAVEDAAEFPAEQAGKMLVLGRFKVSDGSTYCRVRLESGFENTTAYNKRGRVIVSGTSWVIYPLGQVSFSESGRGSPGLDMISKQRLRISAERYSGSGTMDMDCLILIPTDEGFISLQGESDLESLITPVEYPLLISQSADDRVSASGYQIDSGQARLYYSDLLAQVTGGAPIGDHVQIIFAAQRSLGSLLQDEVDLTLDVYRRWQTLRGAE